MTESFRNEFKNVDALFLGDEEPAVAVPRMIYVANKAEDGYEGDVLADFYHKFPHTVHETGSDPIFISAEHGDGLPDLYQAIKQHIPPDSFRRFQDRKEKRISRYLALKEQLLEEIVQFKIDLMDSERENVQNKPKRRTQDDEETEEDLEMFVRQWEKDFDKVNKDPELNSDFDSDNEINPIDTVE